MPSPQKRRGQNQKNIKKIINLNTPLIPKIIIKKVKKTKEIISGNFFFFFLLIRKGSKSKVNFGKSLILAKNLEEMGNQKDTHYR